MAEEKVKTADELLAEIPVTTEVNAVSGKPAGKVVRGPKKEYRSVPKGRAYVQASYNNTLVTMTDEKGDTLSWSSSGKCGFKGPKKSTAYASGVVVRQTFGIWRATSPGAKL